MIERRSVIVGFSFAVLGLPGQAPAQPARKVYRIGILTNAAAADGAGPQPRNLSVNAFVRAMRELGYVFGEHFVTESRGSEGRPERFPGLADELVRLGVDVIVTSGTALRALKQATATIPVVMAGSIDPVGQGFIRSLARPGTNFTGLTLQLAETTGKRLELLKEIVPSPAPIAILWDPLSRLTWQAAEVAARERGWKLLSLEIRGAGEIEAAFKVARNARAGALHVAAGSITDAQASRVAELAAASRLPTIYQFRSYPEAGGLMSYGASLLDNWRRAAVFVDKILKGANAGDLPVEQPTKFEFVINLRTAKALGITIPQSVLLRADEVIQ
ncbi:MAG: ABC transporter substrate-binding protein [Rhodoferax sp.]|nr:ABC transporter substrate-binding protein [Rhodoferax sp.]